LREDVGIILNDREPTKAKLAELLELRFKDKNITSSRISVDRHTAAVVTERRPRLLVLDYLLGDYTTGLDVLAAVQRIPTEERPRVIFLTDEPSINVAVQAMKGGAEDFIEIDSPNAVHTTMTAAERILTSCKAHRPMSRDETVVLDDLVAGAPAMQQTIRNLRHAISRRPSGLVLFGARGSGITTLARGALTAIESTGAWSYIDTTTFLGAPADLPGISAAPRGGIVPRDGHTVVLDHAEYDDGEILTTFASGRAHETHARGTVLTCTTDETTARAFAQATGAEIISVPDLAARRSDIASLAQRFLKEAEGLAGKKISPFDGEILRTLSEKSWPGNVRQLRSVVIDTALDGLRIPVSTNLLTENYTLSCEQDHDGRTEYTLDPLTVAAIFEMSGRHYRRTAARLGCSVASVRRALDYNATESGAGI